MERTTLIIMKLYLASKSPRRHELLKQIGVEFEIINVDIDETWDEREIARDYVFRLALEKARAGKTKITADNNALILAADTAVVIDNVILGKAENKEDAARMLHLLSGRTHHVYTSIALISSNEEMTSLNTSRVSFKPLSENEIKTYCISGEPSGKAGAYAIQGKAGAFIERIEGSYSGIMGLPLYETWQLIQSMVSK